jgi:hypothetical protein
MTGDAAFVEGQQRVRVSQLNVPVHAGGDRGGRDAGQAAVGVVQERGAGHAEDGRGRGRFAGADAPQAG